MGIPMGRAAIFVPSPGWGLRGSGDTQVIAATHILHAETPSPLGVRPLNTEPEVNPEHGLGVAP